MVVHYSFYFRIQYVSVYINGATVDSGYIDPEGIRLHISNRLLVHVCSKFVVFLQNPGLSE